MLLVFVGLYVILGVVSVMMGIAKRSRRAVVCGFVALALAAASVLVGAMYAAGVTHWTVSVLSLLLSPLPESVLQPQSLADAGTTIGVPVIALSATELIVAIALWAVPITGIVAAGRTTRREVPRA